MHMDSASHGLMLALSDLLETCRGLRARGLSRNSHRLGFSSLTSRRRVSPLAILLPASRGTRQLIRATGANRSRAQILPVQQRCQALADTAFIHRLCLSSAVSVGIYPNEIGLTHAYKPLPSRGKAYV